MYVCMCVCVCVILLYVRSCRTCISLLVYYCDVYGLGFICLCGTEEMALPVAG